MKKITTSISSALLCVMLCPIMVFAQLEVDATGKVGIGTTTPLNHKLEVVGNTYANGSIYIGGASNFIATTSYVPIIFKVNNSVMAGSTGALGNSNVSFGYQALINPTGNNNVAIGCEALYSNSSGINNVATGYQALYSNTTGYQNIAIGSRALYSNTSTSNIAIGYFALQSNTTGSQNTAISSSALSSNTTGTGNTTNGYMAFFSNTTGSWNTAIGYGAFYSNTTGNQNTAIGYGTGTSANNLNNATAIGSMATVTASNQVQIGNSVVTSIGGYAGWTTYPSDGKAKKNIQANVPGLNFINSLQPVTYNLDLDVIDELLKSDDPKINHFRDSLRMARSPEEKEMEAKARAAKQKQVQTGFIAQDVEKTAKSIGYDFSGVDVDEMGIYGLRYAEFVVPLVKAVQELSEQNNSLQEQVNKLIEAVKGQQDIIDALQATCCAPQQQRAAKVLIDESDAVNVFSTERQAQLFQNTPNPFNQSTQIKFYVPESVSKASLCIYDLQGRQLKQTTITQRGYGIETVFASEFTAGIYLYALLADGDQIDVKRMILTE